MSIIPFPIRNLWNGTVLDLPQYYADWYRSCVRTLGREWDAKNKPPKGIIGGATDKEAEDHLVYRFPNSGARACFAFLDPRGELVAASHPLQAALVDGHVVVVDIPAGAGALSLGIVSTLIVLRENGVLPKLPLKISIVAGDISQKALELASLGYSAIQHQAAQVGIELNVHTLQWDVLDFEHSAHLVDEAFLMGDADSYVIGVLDFAGALKDQSLRDEFTHALKAMLGRFYAEQDRAILVWLEPMTSDNSKLQAVLNSALSRVGSWVGSNDTYRSKFRLRHPISAAEIPTDVELREAQKVRKL